MFLDEMKLCFGIRRKIEGKGKDAEGESLGNI